MHWILLQSFADHIKEGASIVGLPKIDPFSQWESSLTGWQKLAGFRRAQNNPSELSLSAYLQNFATKRRFFYNCVNIGSFWL